MKDPMQDQNIQGKKISSANERPNARSKYTRKKDFFSQ
jgi:hypothetical protein